MAQLNITLNQEEILQLLKNNTGDVFKNLLQESLNSVLKAESSSQLHAEPYERTEDRTDSRNGYRERQLNTRIGTITLRVPRHRDQPFKSMVFENYSRSEAALVASLAEMYTNGVSTRKVGRVVETLCGTTISKSAVSDLCKDLDEAVESFRERRLDEFYPFVTIDATYFKVIHDRRTVSRALMIAYAVNQEGIREIIGFQCYEKESKETWKAFLNELRDRGLRKVGMFISDSHEGILHAIAKVYPDSPWQRCQFHFTRNILDKMPKKYIEGMKTELQEMFNSKTLREAQEKRDSIIEDYRDVSESAVECLDNGFDDAMTVMVLPEKIRKQFRTSNHIERVNKELKRRSKVVGRFPTEASVMRLMESVLIELNDALMEKASKIIYRPGFEELEKCRKVLVLRAREQHQMLAA